MRPHSNGSAIDSAGNHGNTAAALDPPTASPIQAVTFVRSRRSSGGRPVPQSPKVHKYSKQEMDDYALWMWMRKHAPEQEQAVLRFLRAYVSAASAALGVPAPGAQPAAAPRLRLVSARPPSAATPPAAPRRPAMPQAAQMR